MSFTFKNIVSAGGGGTLPPAADFASLPVSGNTDGDLRVTLDNHSLYVWNAGTAVWDLVSSIGSGVISVNGDVGPNVVINTDNVSEGAANQYFTAARAKAAAVADAIVNGVLDVAPSQNAVFDALALKINSSLIAANNGVASLDAGGKVPVSQLPSSLMEFKGNWNATTNTPALADGIGDPGDVYRVNVAGTQNLGSGAQVFVVGDWAIYDASGIWQKSHSGADSVLSVNGASGVVVVNAINQLTGDVTATAASGSESKATTIANLARSKLASGTAFRIAANNASGVLSENADITASRAVVSDANGQLLASATTTTELSHVSGVTSAIQTQINAITASGINTVRVANTVLSGPATGADALPTFRPLVAADIPVQNSSKITNAQTNRFAQFDGTGTLNPLSTWTIPTIYGAKGLGVNSTLVINDNTPNYNKFFNLETEIDPSVASSNVTVVVHQLDSHLDRSGSNNDFTNQYINFGATQSVEGNGTNGDVYLSNTQQNLQGAGSGSADEAYLNNSFTTVSPTYTLNRWIGNQTGLNVQAGGAVTDISACTFNSQGIIANDVTGYSYFHTGNVGNNVTALNMGIQGDVARNVTLTNTYLTGNVGSSFTGSNVQVTGNVVANASLFNGNFVGDADNFTGVSISATGNFANSAKGLDINMQNAVLPGLIPPTGLVINGGIINTDVNISVLNNATVQVGNNLNARLVVPAGSPSSGTDAIAHALPSGLFAEDHVGLGPIGFGMSAIGYVGQSAVSAGKVVDAMNMALSGASIPVESTGGKVTDWAMCRVLDVFSAGGTLDITNLYGLKIDAGFGSLAQNVHSLYLDTASSLNYIGGKTLFGASYSAPTVEVDVDGDLRVRGLTAIGVVLNDASGNIATLAPGSSGNVLQSDGSNWQSVAAILPILSGPVTLVNNTAVATDLVTFANTNSFAIYEYSIVRGVNRKTGRLIVASDGTVASLIEDGVEQGSVGVSFSATISGGLVRIQYTTTNSGSNGSFKYFSKVWA